jgi:hypothetical protein
MGWAGAAGTCDVRPTKLFSADRLFVLATSSPASGVPLN